MSNTLEHVILRPSKQEDVPFIFSSWLKSYKESHLAKSVRPDIYYSEHHALIDSLIKKAMCFCAVNKTDDEQIFGWICVNLSRQPAVLHYVYVKHPYRKLGISKLLLNLVPSPYIYTHESRFKLTGDVSYNPYEFFREGYK